MPPVLGTAATYNTLASQLLFDVSSDGGLTFQSVSASANMSLIITHTANSGGTEYYDTELLSLDFTGGAGLPAGVRFRESPTRQSLGQTTIRQLGTRYAISSFIDIWTDVSLDNGQTWAPADHAARVAAIAPPVLSIGLEGTQAVVSWYPESPYQRLQSATNVTGPWADVAGATSPFRLNVINTTRKFFKVVEP